MGGNESKKEFIGEEIICPKCPLTPIISIFLNPEGILTCEYRCSFMHFGQIPFEDISKDKENKHGKFCDRCVNSKGKDEKNNAIKGELVYCGTCKQFICTDCVPEHNKQKESHKILIPKNKLRYTCLEHDKKYIGFCFTCLLDICEDCARHNKHCKKRFEEFYPEKDFIDNYKYYIGDFKDYIKSFRRSKGMNQEHFSNFKKRCELLINLAVYLKENFEDKRKKNKLNGEILINLLNVVSFNFRADNYDTNEAFVKYCKTHLILSNKPISDICTFSKTKSDYNISKLVLEEYKKLDNIDNKNIEYFKYSPIGNHIAYSIGTCIHFLSANEGEKENSGFKIRFDNQISSFNIINYNILCVCCNKLFLYQLSKNPPFYSEYKTLPILDLFKDPVLEVVGNLEKNLVVRTKTLLALVNDKKKKGEYEIVSQINLDDINRTFKEKKEVPIEKSKKTYNDDYYYYGYGNYKKTKTIEILRNVLTSVKAIVNDYVITIENGVITSRNLKDLNIVSQLNSHKNIDCLVFNENVIIFDFKDILFYSIPNLEKVSSMTVNDDIVSLNIVNKKTFIVLQKKYIEQFETKTWKRLWRQISMGGEGFNLEKAMIIGAGKKLFLYNKENNTVYQAVLKKEDDKKKGKK